MTTENIQKYMSCPPNVLCNVCSSPRYMAPEVLALAPGHAANINAVTDQQVLPPCGPKVDVWSLGIILVEAILVSVRCG